MLFRFSAGCFCFLFFAASSFSERGNLDVRVVCDSPDFERLLSPLPNGNFLSKSFRPLEWLETEFSFKVNVASDARVVDELVFRYYVLVENPENGEYFLLSKEVKHINVPVKKELFSSFYLSPSSLFALGVRNANGRMFKATALEIFYKGEVVGGFASPNRKWWKQKDLQRGPRNFLRSKNETPFKFLWWDRYAEIEEK